MIYNITLCLIKPCAVKRNLIGAIISIIEQNNFVIKNLKMLTLTNSQAKKFYEIHKNKEFYNDLCAFMTSGPIVAILLEKEQAVNDFRNIIGKTNPLEADKGTIRNLFGISLRHNAVHGSDSIENANIEAKFFFDL